jgi:hypothetical protein
MELAPIALQCVVAALPGMVKFSVQVEGVMGEIEETRVGERPWFALDPSHLNVYLRCRGFVFGGSRYQVTEAAEVACGPWLCRPGLRRVIPWEQDVQWVYFPPCLTLSSLFAVCSGELTMQRERERMRERE